MKNSLLEVKRKYSLSPALMRKIIVIANAKLKHLDAAVITQLIQALPYINIALVERSRLPQSLRSFAMTKSAVITNAKLKFFDSY